MNSAVAVDLSDDEVRRYIRQLVVSPFGTPGQLALRSARVLVVGAGGLGSPVIAYLAAAGIGTLGIVDNDDVSLSNLNRQVLYRSSDVGASKAERAAAFAAALNDEICVVPHKVRLDVSHALELVANCDVVVDGSDNITTRRLVAAAALRLGRPMVCGAIGQLEGHVAVFPPRGVAIPVGFEQLYPDSFSDDAPSCEANGVIGAVAGVIGSIMAMETIKLISNLGSPIEGRVVHYDALTGRFSDVDLGTPPRLRVLVGG